MLCSSIRVILCAYVEPTVFEDAMQQESRSETSTNAVISAAQDTFISVRSDSNDVYVQTTRNRVGQLPADHQVAVMARQTDY